MSINYFTPQNFIITIITHNSQIIDYLYTFEDEEEEDEIPALLDIIDGSISNYRSNNQEDRHLYKKVITEDEYTYLKNQKLLYRDLNELEKIENIVCPISMEYFNEDDSIIKLKCGHFFHREPILYWLYMQNSICPMCRYEYPFIEKRI
jgi:hypothetical protein